MQEVDNSGAPSLALIVTVALTQGVPETARSYYKPQQPELLTAVTLGYFRSGVIMAAEEILRVIDTVEPD